MVNALFSIRPPYADAILRGDKRVEFRKHACKRPVTRMFIYATKPIASIVGEAAVTKVLSRPPSDLWELTHAYAGISEDRFDRYFDGCEQACAYFLTRPMRYQGPIALDRLGIWRPPQSFCYLSEDQAEMILRDQTLYDPG